MIGGAIVSMLVFAVGAVLDFAVTTSPYQHGFNIRNVGVILMIVGVVGFVLALTAWSFAGGGYRVAAPPSMTGGDTSRGAKTPTCSWLGMRGT
jgi:hypothetical protein